MAGNLASVGNNGIAAGSQQVSRAGSERQAERDIGKALASNDIAAAKIAVASFKEGVAAQGTRTDFQNAVKALDEALKANDTKSATTAFSELQQSQRRVQQRPQAPPDAEAPRQAAPATETRARQQAGQAEQVQKSNEQDFITRQDLAAKAASNAGPTEQQGRGLGVNVDIEV